VERNDEQNTAVPLVDLVGQIAADLVDYAREKLTAGAVTQRVSCIPGASACDSVLRPRSGAAGFRAGRISTSMG
jgi:hypothetical protein